MSITVIEGHFNAKSFKIGIVIARFNDFITNKLLDGAMDAFKRHEGQDKNLTVMKVPGAYEIPLACQKMAMTKQFDGILSLGAVIRGSTPHFDYVSSEVAKGVAHVSLEQNLPVSHPPDI